MTPVSGPHLTPDDFDADVAREREAFTGRSGSYEAGLARLEAQRNLRPLGDVIVLMPPLAMEVADLRKIVDAVAVEVREIQ